MFPTILIAVLLLCTEEAAAVLASAAAADLQAVSPQEALSPPLSAVGQLSNGCTGYLIGPCHVMTVAHCVYEPWRKIWWRGLDFHPGRNVGAEGVGWSPLGCAAQHDVRLHPNWTSTAAGSASDAAIIITRTPIGRQAGWFSHSPPEYIRQQPQQQQQQQPGESWRSADGLGSLIAAQELSLHIAGYPDSMKNGSVWQQCCSELDWQLQGNLLWHDCYARGGNSGSPVWVVWPTQQPQAAKVPQGGPNSSTSTDVWPRVQAVGVHSSSLKFPKESQLAVYAAELYAQGIARAQQQQQQQQQQRQSGAAAGPGALSITQCKAVTPSLTATLSRSATNTTASSRLASQRPSANQPEASGSLAGASGAAGELPIAIARLSATAAQAHTTTTQAATAAAAGSMVRPVTGRRALLAGAGGREDDGEHTLLPVAVPFHGDNLKWIDQVLQEFEKCPGE